FRPGGDYTRAAAPHLQPLHRSPTCAHPIPRFMGGTNEAAESVGNGPAARLLSTVAPFWVATDPLLQAVEQRVRSHAQTRWLLADVPVLQELFVFVKPLDAQPARTGDPALSVVVIAYNEDEGLVGMVDELMATLREGTVSFEIVLVDDGSTDETGSIMESLEKEHQGVTVRRHTPNRGIGGALRAGFDAASGNYLTWLPADSQIPPGVVLELFDRRRLGAIVTTVYRERADHWMRNVISKSLNAMIWLRTGHVAKSGGNYLMSRATWEEYGPRGDDSMMLSTAFRNNVRNAGHLVIEHEIDCRARAAGRSKVLNPTTIFRTVAGLLRAGER
ncbi:MAG: glycosyltransferase family 2 protein, partial [Myxococcota bacterium]